MAKCYLCQEGFPRNGGYHYGSQSKGMIPSRPCEDIQELTPNQVFVFGTNMQGFHGAGAAGLAMRGDTRNNWRQDQDFIDKMAAHPQSLDRRGKWAVLGVARGLMAGTDGLSYGIVTVTRAGLQRSVSLDSIRHQVETLIKFATSLENQGLVFIMSKIGCGLAGYTTEEIKKHCFDGLVFPTNIILPREFS